MRSLTISTIKNKFDTSPKRLDLSWEELRDKLSKTTYTAETSEEYSQMSSEDKGKAKDVGAFIGGYFDEPNTRNTEHLKARSLATIDIDKADEVFLDYLKGLLKDYEWLIYSTHSHNPKKGAFRYRLVMPLEQDCNGAVYSTLTLHICKLIGEEYIDLTTVEPARIMYFPSTSLGGDYKFYCNTGKFLDPTIFTNTAGTISKKKAEDPLHKSGAVGLFCKTYTISEAIQEYLSSVYKKGSIAGRYTYINGESSNGLVIYNSDTLAYSNHATDPICQKCVNAFDLVRLHKFGYLDIKSKTSEVTKLPSYKAMCELVDADPKCKDAVEKSMLEDITGALNEEEKASVIDALKGKLRYKKGKIEPSIYNYRTILDNDAMLKGKVYRDMFSGFDVVVGNLPWRKASESKEWNNADESQLAFYFSNRYGLDRKDIMVTAWDTFVDDNRKHPVRDYFKSLPKWDGVARIETLFIDYLGVRDTTLTRCQTRKHLIAGVKRIFEPGCKYDYVLTLKGPEGIGKSTIIRYLAGEWFSDSIFSIEGKEAMDAIQGKWLIEFSELVNYSKSTNETYKSFISKTADDYRPPYQRRTERRPRQCIFFASTNEDYFLKGSTGNRRFWVLECGVDLPAKSIWEDLPKEVDQIWAEAYHYYKLGESLELPKELKKDAEKVQEEFNELNEQSRKAMIEEFILTPVPTNWEELLPEQKLAILRNPAQQSGITKQRTYISAVEILYEFEGRKLDNTTRYKAREINKILNSIEWLEFQGKKRLKGYGAQNIYLIKNEG